MGETKERVAALEEGYKHLATKLDLITLKGQLEAQMAHIEGQLDILIWALPLAVAIVTGIVQWAIPSRKSS